MTDTALGAGSVEPVTTDLIIGGEHRPSRSGERIEVRNPARPDELVGWAAGGDDSDATAAVDAAAAAFPEWAALSYAERGQYLKRIVAELDQNLAERTRLFDRENGKVLGEASTEMSRLGVRFEYTASLADVLSRDEVHSGPPLETVVTRQPMGVAALIVPWNWPLSILGAKLPQALMAGNTVVIKPSSSAPLATVQTIALMARVLPPGVINVVTGSPEHVATTLLAHPAVRKVDVTGGVQTGKDVMAAAARSLKRVTLELGGNDAGIVLHDADLSKETFARLALGAFMTAGQVCMGLKRLYVHESIIDDVVDGLRETLDTHIVGDGLDPRSTMGPVINARQQQHVRELIDEAKASGACVDELGSPRDDEEFAHGYFVLPTLVSGCRPDLRVVTEEQFGPVLPVLPFSIEAEAVALANDSSFGLASSVWSTDIERAVALARRIEAGYSYINAHGPMTQDNRAPFGGVKDSGIGRQLGLDGVLEFTDAHAITVRAH